jgi:outer membrane protein OmpA-like peptidoglycan-associated protein
LTAANSKSIKDVDARAQEGIRQASAKANEADQHAVDAGNRAQQANQTALQASNRLNTVEQVVGSLDQYQPATQTEIRFRPGQTKLSTKAQAALDDMAVNLKDQKGYVIEVQGYSPSRGQAGISTSQSMANSVVRYLVEKHDIPVYRIFVMGLGNAQMASAQESSSQPGTDGTAAKPYHGNRVEVSLMKNNVDQLAAANQPNGGMNSAPSNAASSDQPRQ